MTGTAILFLAFVVAMSALICVTAAQYLPMGAAAGGAAVLAAWLVYVGTLSRLGVIADPALRPPGITYVVVPVFLFVFLAIVRSQAAGRVALAVPLPVLIGLQSFRIGVELFLHRLWREGFVPRMLTWDGANVDIWIGASAPVAALLVTKGRTGERIAFGWSVLGLLALANVVVRSALTAPGPLNFLHAEVANRAIGAFPYTFLAGFLAPLAVVLHVLALRALAGRLARRTNYARALLKGFPA